MGTLTGCLQTPVAELPPSEAVTLTIEADLEALKNDGVVVEASVLEALQGDITASYLDTIEKTSDPLHRMSDITALVELLALVYQIRSPSPTTTSHLETLIRTITAGKLDDQLEPIAPDQPSYFTDPLASSPAKPTTSRATKDKVLDSFARFLSPVLNGLAGLTAFESHPAIHAVSDPVGFRQFWSLDGGRNLFVEANGSATELLSSPAAELATTPGEELPEHFLDAFVLDQGRQVALTRDRGMLALVPAGTRPHDEIWLVHGDESPVVLRREVPEGTEASSGLKVVGEAFVYRCPRRPAGA